MIRGYFVAARGRKRPSVDGVVMVPSLRSRGLLVRFLVDTGADRTVLSSDDASDLGVALTALTKGPLVGGVGGRVQTLVTDAVLTMGSFSTSLLLTIPLPRPGIPAIPSILGRDILSRFALFMEERTERVLLLEPAEADRLDLS